MYSSLCKMIIESPNHSGQRTEDVCIITPHSIVGQASMQTLGNIFANPSREASSNYGACIDGIVGIVSEDNRSWCSSSDWNDQRAITIEIADEPTTAGEVRPEVWDMVIDLCVDICKRYGFKKLVNCSNLDDLKNKLESRDSDTCLLSQHNWYSATSCPGDWIKAHMQELADRVTALLNDEPAPVEEEAEVLYRVQVGAYKNRKNAEIMLMDLENAGFKGFIATVNVSENKVIEQNPVDAEPEPVRKSPAEIAQEIYCGTCSDDRWDTWGNGQERRDRLAAAGYNYSEVQNEVNKLFS